MGVTYATFDRTGMFPVNTQRPAGSVVSGLINKSTTRHVGRGNIYSRPPSQPADRSDPQRHATEPRRPSLNTRRGHQQATERLSATLLALRSATELDTKLIMLIVLSSLATGLKASKYVKRVLNC